jgi:hypothetical protein
MSPFPSDRFTKPDSVPMTGSRLSLTLGDNSLTDEAMGFLIPATEMAGLLSLHDGFALSGPILFPFSAPLDPDSLLSGGESPAVRMVRLESDGSCDGEVPFSLQLLEGQGESGDLTILEVRPVELLREATRYAVVVTTGVKGHDGLSVGPDESFLVPDALLCLARGEAPVCPEEIVSATLFTTGAPATALRLLRDWLYGLDAPDLDLWTDEGTPAEQADIWPDSLTSFPASSVVVRGLFTAPMMLDADGGMPWVAGEPIQARGTLRIPFVLLMPDESIPGPWPVAVMAHGMNASKERVAYIAQRFNEAGFALAAIDAPDHGELDGVGDMNSYDVGSMRGSYRQAHVNLLTFFRALNLLGEQWRSSSTEGAVFGRLDPSLGLSFVGESMGGITGSAACAIEPTVRGVVLNVTGGGLSGFLMGYVGPLFPPEKRYMVPVLESLAQPILDQVDPISFVPDMQSAAGRSVLLQAVVGDTTVMNHSTDLLARVLGLTQVCPCPVTVSGLDHLEPPALVNAVTYFADAAHGFFLKNASNPPVTDRARRQAVHFLKTALTGQGEVIDSAPED